MMTITKPTKAPCFVCGDEKDSIETTVQGQTIALCWKDARRIFNARTGNGKPKKSKTEKTG